MTDVVVWSERNDPAGGEHDCAYSSILMVLVHGGKTTYPLGEYTAAEREALERSDARPDEEGASPTDIDLAILTRYGLRAHAPAAGADLRSVLTTPGLAISVGGQLSNLPAGHPLRRWAPTYTGGHRICFLTTSRTWLDPLAPWKYAGDTATVDNVVTFAQKRAVTDLRYLKANELALTGGIGGGIEIMGLQTELGNPPIVGKLAIAVGADAIRVSDHQAYKVTTATSRDAVTAALVGAAAESGYLVDLVGAGPVAEQHFIRRSEPVTFTPAAGAGDVTHTVTLAVDGVPKASVTV